jgi:hypothetical protein
MVQSRINSERYAVINLRRIAFGASAAVALVFTAVSASAQLAPPAPKAPPAAAPAATKAAPAAKPAAAKKAASACQGLDQKGCGAKATECRWIAAVKRKDGKEVAAYCRSLPKSVKAAPKKQDAKAGAPAAAPAVKAPAAPAAKAPPAMAK